MRIKSIYLFLASVMGSAFIAVGCMEKEDVILSSSEYITFRPTIQNGAQISTRGLSSHFEVCEEDWLLELAPEETKADLRYTLGSYTDGAGVFGYYTSGETTGIWDLLNNAPYKFDGDEMYSDAPPRWSKVPDNTSSMKVYAYAPRIDGNSSNKIMIDDERSIINLFYGVNVSLEQLEYIEGKICEKYMYTEVCRIPTEETIYDLTVSFE